MCRNIESRIAFTRPSRATNVVRDELASTETLSFRCKSERWRLTRGAVAKSSNKVAFTLAEVLITLGIIGIVAAMTLPSIVANYKRKALEVSFKKAYANFYNAYNKAQLKSPPLWDDNDTVTNNPELAQAIYAEYSQIEGLSSDERLKYAANVRTYTLGKAVRPECSHLNFYNAITTSDGSTVSVSRNCGTNWVVIDTNGIRKGPNAYGHDIFIFNISKEGVFSPAESEVEGAYDDEGNQLPGYDYSPEKRNKCSKDSPSKLNGSLCAGFALQNKCPDNPLKTYWECLR